ncbi:hypothetical protein [Algoriphagus terrigena]|uniref:hypothetical protein n=1 Tax=Algoriphagus terrigena TaxID=344884 RepID=UPI0012F72325|nr:hypothetical protein [Algoriphagus terrigena]
MAQLFMPSIKYFLVIEYIYKNGEFVNLISEEILKGNPAIGTFIRPANLGNVLAVFVPFYYYLYTTYRLKINRIVFWTIFILFVFTLINTGIRTSFVSFVFCQVGFMLLIYRRRLVFVFTGFVCAAIFVTVISSKLNLEFYERGDFSSPLMRVFYLFNYFDSGSSIVEESTLSRSSNIFAYYESFFFGSGFMSSGGIVQGISSITDLTLAFIFVEYGFIVLMLSLVPFSFPVLGILRTQGRGREFYISLVLFTTLILQTITDQGLFTNYCSYMYFFVMAYFGFDRT